MGEAKVSEVRGAQEQGAGGKDGSHVLLGL